LDVRHVAATSASNVWVVPFQYRVQSFVRVGAADGPGGISSAAADHAGRLRWRSHLTVSTNQDIATPSRLEVRLAMKFTGSAVRNEIR
jgi:hypothetical protein